MPLDRHKGEFIPKYGQHDLPIPENHVWRETPFFAEAREDAVRAFMATAKKNHTFLNPKIQDDEWFAQTYHKQGRLVFLFQKLVRIRPAGARSVPEVRERFHVVPILFGPNELRELALKNMWPVLPSMLQLPPETKIKGLPYK